MTNIKQNTILNNAEKKIPYFNRIGIHYEVVYHYVIRKREETNEIYDEDFLNDIVAGLISFDMQRMMGQEKYIAEGKNSWAGKLHSVLETHKTALESLRTYKLQSINFDDTEIGQTVKMIFHDLSKPGPEGLSQRSDKQGFPVGASKILHFLIPDLFIILDSNAKRELRKFYEFPNSKINGSLYLEAIKAYQRELKQWVQTTDDPQFQKLLAIDTSWKNFGGIRTTPLPRVIDKCTFVGENFFL